MEESEKTGEGERWWSERSWVVWRKKTMWFVRMWFCLKQFYCSDAVKAVRPDC